MQGFGFATGRYEVPSKSSDFHYILCDYLNKIKFLLK